MGADQTTSYPPPPPREGRRVLSYLSDLFKWLKRNQAIAGVGLTSTQTESGKIFRISDTLQLPPPHPFKISPRGGLNYDVQGGELLHLNLDAQDGQTFNQYRFEVDGMTDGDADDNSTTHLYVKYWLFRRALYQLDSDQISQPIGEDPSVQVDDALFGVWQLLTDESLEGAPPDIIASASGPNTVFTDAWDPYLNNQGFTGAGDYGGQGWVYKHIGSITAEDGKITTVNQVMKENQWIMETSMVHRYLSS